MPRIFFADAQCGTAQPFPTECRLASQQESLLDLVHSARGAAFFEMAGNRARSYPGNLGEAAEEPVRYGVRLASALWALMKSYNAS
jgi:hypothetical protein